ncbi:MAG: bifunctional diaminohydroxyphosphoribosylaminopyrimidine deaminase/5-amino-6-(5-phosphoribosylamino)uracil reductase RibD [Candidatus Zixiibacteriota bacterium]
MPKCVCAPKYASGFFMADADDTVYMQRALTLAEKGRGMTSPNPMVGAVIVKNGEIIGEAYHRAVGKEHAEVAALRRAGRKAQGATMFVNLEPCCHTGLTSPCTEAIIKAGIKKVIYSVIDPDPRVSGKGARILKQAGIKVENGLLNKEALLLNESYFGYHQYKRPFIILKIAQTLDGRIATMTGDSKWISSPQSLKLAHQLRAEVDGVVIGMGTVRKDNPALTVRLVKGRNPYRIILSGSLDFPPKCQLLDNNSDCKTIIAATPKVIERFSKTKRGRKPGLIYWNLSSDTKGLVNLYDFATKAGEFGLRSLLVEGGSMLASSFLKEGLVDKYIVVIAPLVLGGGVHALDGIRPLTMSDALTFERYSFEKCGTDSLFVGYPRRSA